MRTLNDEELNKLADLEIAALEKKAAAQGEINSLLKLQNKILGEVAEQEAVITDRKLEINKMEMESFTILEETKTEIHAENLEIRREGEQAFHDGMLQLAEEEKQAKIDAMNEYIAAAQDIGNTLFSFNAQLLDGERIRLENAKAYELQLAGDNADKKAKVEKKYDDEMRKLRTKQARAEKAQALFGAIINTARAVTAAMTAGPGIGLVLAAITAVLAGIQVGIIASQPIPAFAKGTKRAPRGLAWVGERGRELIAGPDGLALTPGTASLVNLGRGGQRIYNNRETEMILRAAKGADTPELKKMMQQMHQDNDRLVETIKNNRPIYHFDKSRRISERGGYGNYFDKKITG